MIDTLLTSRDKAEQSLILEQMGLEKKKYDVITLHRPCYVVDMAHLEKIIAAFEVIQYDYKLVFPMHPRTKMNIAGRPLQSGVASMNNLLLVENRVVC